MVEIFVNNNERQDILTGLRIWLRENGATMKGDTLPQLEALYVKIDALPDTLEDDWVDSLPDDPKLLKHHLNHQIDLRDRMERDRDAFEKEVDRLIAVVTGKKDANRIVELEDKVTKYDMENGKLRQEEVHIRAIAKIRGESIVKLELENVKLRKALSHHQSEKVMTEEEFLKKELLNKGCSKTHDDEDYLEQLRAFRKMSKESDVRVGDEKNPETSS